LAGASRVAEAVVGLGLVRLGEFTLSSGRRSRLYIDLRELPMHPTAFREAAEALASLVERAVGDTGSDTLAGVATGGILWAAAVGLLLGMPVTYVRPEPKSHGRGRLVEADVEGRRIVVVDDVATTGGSLARAVQALRAAGGDPRAAVVVVDRLQGAGERLAGEGVRLYSLLTACDLLRVMEPGRPGDPLLASALEELGCHRG